MGRFRKLEMDELGRLPSEQVRLNEKLPLVLVLDNLRSLSNVGSVFRTADALGVEALYLCGFTGQPPNREIEKTALGATDSVTWKHFPDICTALSELKQRGFHLAALEQTTASTALQDFHELFPLAVVLGNEIHGVSDEALEMVDSVIEIPQFGMKHSLNVSVSAGMLVWQLLSRRLKS